MVIWLDGREFLNPRRVISIRWITRLPKVVLVTFYRMSGTHRFFSKSWRVKKMRSVC